MDSACLNQRDGRRTSKDCKWTFSVLLTEVVGSGGAAGVRIADSGGARGAKNAEIGAGNAEIGAGDAEIGAGMPKLAPGTPKLALGAPDEAPKESEASKELWEGEN
jgi:hypothetical protein